MTGTCITRVLLIRNVEGEQCGGQTWCPRRCACGIVSVVICHNFHHHFSYPLGNWYVIYCRVIFIFAYRKICEVVVQLIPRVSCMRYYSRIGFLLRYVAGFNGRCSGIIVLVRKCGRIRVGRGMKWSDVNGCLRCARCGVLWIRICSGVYDCVITPQRIV